MNDFDPKPLSRHAKMFDLLRQSTPRSRDPLQEAIQERYLDDRTADQMILRGLSSLRPLGEPEKSGKRPGRRMGPFVIRSKT